MPENELLEKNIATFNPKAIQEKQQYHTELEEMIKSNEESLKEENDKEQHILSEFEGKVGNLGDDESDKFSGEGEDEFNFNHQNYEANRQSEEHESHVKSQDHDFKIHYPKNFIKAKRSKNSEAIELQDFEDSSEEEVDLKPHQANKQLQNKSNFNQKFCDQEEPNFITEPLDRQNYEERKIKKSQGSSGKQSLHSIKSSEQDKIINHPNQPEPTNVIIDKLANIPSIIKPIQNTGKNDSTLRIGQPSSCESVHSNKIHSSSLKSQKSSEKILPKYNTDESDLLPVNYDSHIDEKFTKEKKLGNISETIIDNSLVNPNIRNLRNLTSHDFEGIREIKNFEQFNQTPNGQSSKKQVPILSNESSIKNSKRSHISSYKDPSSQQDKYSDKDSDNLFKSKQHKSSLNSNENNELS